MHKLDRKVIALKKKNEEKKFEKVQGDPAYLCGMVGEMTGDVWTLKGGGDAERRLQRNVTNVVRRKG